VASLCSGLKSTEEAFDISLFTERVKGADVDAISTKVDVTALKQRWIGFPSPVLKEVEQIALLAVLAHSGVLQRDMKDTKLQGQLLYAAREVLKVKDAVQSEYRKQASSDQSSSWQAVAEGALSRANLLLEYSGAVVSEPQILVIEELEDALHWVQDNAASDSVCLRIDACRRFIQNDAVLCSEVTRVLEARSQCVEEAELGYSSAIELLQAGEAHRRDIQRSFTINSGAGQHSTAATGLCGLWKFDVKVTNTADGKMSTMERDYEFACTDEYLFGSSTARGSGVEGDVRPRYSFWIRHSFSHEQS